MVFWVPCLTTRNEHHLIECYHGAHEPCDIPTRLGETNGLERSDFWNGTRQIGGIHEVVKDIDTYSNIAEYWDYMFEENQERTEFFRSIFAENRVKRVLDCACGTGNDLLMFASFNVDVYGSDLSDSMLKVARKKLERAKQSIKVAKVDFHHLAEHYNHKFDAIVCLSNAINEIDIDINKAFASFKSVLNDNGIIIFDQGQSDLTMKNPPKYFPVVNNRDFTRLFTMSYSEDLMQVEIFDFLHAAEKMDFMHSEFLIRIRLYDDWIDALRQSDLIGDFYGDWNFKRYSKENSNRLIVVAKLNQ